MFKLLLLVITVPLEREVREVSARGDGANVLGEPTIEGLKIDALVAVVAFIAASAAAAAVAMTESDASAPLESAGARKDTRLRLGLGPTLGDSTRIILKELVLETCSAWGISSSRPGGNIGRVVSIKQIRPDF